MAKKKIAALLIAAAVAAGGWALPARVSAAENDGTAVMRRKVPSRIRMRKRQRRSRAVLRKTRRRLLRFQVRTTNRSRKRNFLPAG